MENGPFIDDFPIKTSIYEGFSMAMLNNQMVYRDYDNPKNRDLKKNPPCHQADECELIPLTLGQLQVLRSLPSLPGALGPRTRLRRPTGRPVGANW